jgi:hypothetical protein
MRSGNIGEGRRTSAKNTLMRKEDVEETRLYVTVLNGSAGTLNLIWQSNHVGDSLLLF